MISNPKPRARFATSSPTRPSPRMPRVFPRSSAPSKLFFSICRVHGRVCRGQLAPRASIRQSSVQPRPRHWRRRFMTTMPRLWQLRCRCVDAHPGAANDAQFRRCSSSASSTCTALRKPGRRRRPARPATLRQLIVRFTSQPGSAANTASVAEETFSARTIFIASPLAFSAPSNSSKRMPCCSQSKSNMRITAACAFLRRAHTWSAS